jgi:glutamate-1-semialdehyde 2,1-aminomutase
VKAGSGLATFEIQSVPGVTLGSSLDTLTAPYNDLEAVKKLINENSGLIAAIIIEPVAGNMGCILPKKGFLDGLRKLCDEEKIVLIFDEVMTGFRLAAGGAQEALKVDADLVTFGKVIGGGLPVGAFGGKKEIMQLISPLGNVYQAGTLSGNPIAMIAGFTILKNLKDTPGIYRELDEKCAYLAENITRIFEKKQIDHRVNRIGSMISLHFASHDIIDFESASRADISIFNQFFHHMLKMGIYLPPSAYETWFLSNALSYDDLDFTLHAVEKFNPS